LHITDYYSFISGFEKILLQNGKLSSMLKQFSIPVAEENNVSYFNSFLDMLKQLMPRKRQHPEKFPTSLLFWSISLQLLQQSLSL